MRSKVMYSISKAARGALLGSAAALAILATVGGADAAGSYRVLHSFDNRDGRFPSSGAPTVDSAGNVYVTANNGGAADDGTLLKIAPDGTATTLHVFSSTDGADPYGGIALDEADGMIFGTACGGGSKNAGVLYSLDSQGQESVLHSFRPNRDGSCPVDAPYRDPTNGDLYGVAAFSDRGIGCGTVWRMRATGRFTVLHAFDCSDGAYPQSRLIRGQNGLLYGTTQNGGSAGQGTIFSISTNGAFTLLHSFSRKEGAVPYNFLTQDADGSLYGTTTAGGAGGEGTVFKLAPDGTFTVLKAFSGDSNGGAPYSNLVLLNGILYGTTFQGGDDTQCGGSGCGVVFALDMNGNESVLHTFSGKPRDGSSPSAGLARGPGHLLYGDTVDGGKGDYGTVFRLKWPGTTARGR